MSKPPSKPKRAAPRLAKRAKPAPKIRKDPMKEYREAISGDGAKAVSMMDDNCASNVKIWVSTGSLALDTLLNGKGLPCGRITEIYGPQHIGKSTLLDQCFANVQGLGGFGVLIDTEAARDKHYAVHGLGVDPDKLQLLEFADAADIHIEGICDKIIASIDFWRTEYPETPIVIGWDSLGNTTTKDELAKKVGERNVAAAAKAMRDAMRKLVMRLARSNVAFVIVNHQYAAINTHGGRPGARETYAGQAVRLAATLRLELYHKGLIKRQDGVVLGREVGARLDKNRFGWCRETTFALLTGKGTDNVWTLFEALQAAGRIVTPPKSSWSTLQLEDGSMKFQGWSALAEKCEADPALFARLVAIYEGMTRANL